MLGAALGHNTNCAAPLVKVHTAPPALFTAAKGNAVAPYCFVALESRFAMHEMMPSTSTLFARNHQFDHPDGRVSIIVVPHRVTCKGTAFGAEHVCSLGFYTSSW